MCKFVRKSGSDTKTNFLFHFALLVHAIESIAFHSNDNHNFFVASVNTGYTGALTHLGTPTLDKN